MWYVTAELMTESRGLPKERSRELPEGFLVDISEKLDCEAVIVQFLHWCPLTPVHTITLPFEGEYEGKGGKHDGR